MSKVALLSSLKIPILMFILCIEYASVCTILRMHYVRFTLEIVKSVFNHIPCALSLSMFLLYLWEVGQHVFGRGAVSNCGSLEGHWGLPNAEDQRESWEGHLGPHTEQVATGSSHSVSGDCLA